MNIITSYFIPTQPNPTEKGNRSKKCDCVIRAVAIAMDLTWLQAFDALVDVARRTYNVTGDKQCYETYFKEQGIKGEAIKAEKGKKRMTAEDFARAHKHGRYILSLAGHLTAVVDGIIRDTWNCGNKCVYKVYTIED